METGYTIADIMTVKPVVVAPETSIAECAKLMAKYKVGSIIIKENFKPTGVITEQDVVRKIVAEGANAETTLVKEVMAKKLITITPDKDIMHAMELFKENNIRHLPVTNQSKLVGFVTLKDALKYQPQLFEIMSENLKNRKVREFKGDNPNAGFCGGCDDHVDFLYQIKGQNLCHGCKIQIARHE